MVEHGGMFVTAIGTFGLLATSLGAVAVATPYWMQYDLPLAHIRRGFFEECVVQGGTFPTVRCQYLDYPDTFCSSSGTDAKLRLVWGVVLCLLGYCLMALVSALAVLGWCYYKSYSYSCMWLSLLAGASVSGGITLFVHTYDGWYFCGTNFCDYAQTYLGAGPNCLVTYGWSFAFAISSVGAIVATALSSALYIRAERAGRVKKKSILFAKAGKTSAADIEHSMFEMSTAHAHKSLPPRSPGGGTRAFVSQNKREQSASPSRSFAATSQQHKGDWVWKDDVKLYWSATEGLYLHPGTQHFFDPHSEKWYDPRSQQWY